MTFIEPTFFIFFGIVASIYWSLRSNNSRHLFLLIASFVFYGWVDWRFLFLMAGVSLVAWIAPLIASVHVAKSKTVLMVAVSLILLQLGFFKYFDFFTDSFVEAWNGLGFATSDVFLRVATPVGISFYSFHAISYLVDAISGKIETERKASRVFLYIAFFPQLVAGPIVRSTTFFPQLNEFKTLKSEDIVIGVRFFLIGLFYKAVADQIAIFVNTVFGAVAAFGSYTVWSATLGFYAQIYFDFAGYSTMAIGIARLLGFRLPDNFNFPYAATSVSDFWRRWHISLSSWLRDYLYIPLGGNRAGALMKSRNLMITMLLGGLWHGAAWNFVLWGALHGMALVVQQVWSSATRGKAPDSVIGVFPSWLLTQVFVLLAWVPFRAKTWDETVIVFQKLFGWGSTLPPFHIDVPIMLITLPLLVDHVFIRRGLPERFTIQRPAFYWLFIGFLAVIALTAKPLATQAFIYFKF